MTDNQTNQLVNHPNTKKALAALQKFAALEVQYKEQAAIVKEAENQIKQAMIDNGVQKLEGDWGYITLAERTTYSAEDITEVDKKYLKPTLDTSKVKAQATLTGELPAGVTETKTQYITKKIKEVV